MIKPFNIVRDLENKSLTTGSDRIVLTQFDNGIYIYFEILLSGKTITWNERQHSVRATFKNGAEIVIEKEPCVLQQDEGKWRFEITDKLTAKSGTVKGIIDVMDSGVRVASSQFEIVILEHLATN